MKRSHFLRLKVWSGHMWSHSAGNGVFRCTKSSIKDHKNTLKLCNEGQNDIPFKSVQHFPDVFWILAPGHALQAEKELSNLGAHSKQRNDFIALISALAPQLHGSTLASPCDHLASPRHQAWQQEREVTLTHTECPSQVGNHNRWQKTNPLKVGFGKS